MHNYIAEGIVLSQVVCHNERYKAAQRFNKSIEEIPLLFGSVRMAINKIELELNGTKKVYEINKYTDNTVIKEQRLILEISYKFNYKNASKENITGGLIEEHEVVEELEIGKYYSLHMSTSHVHHKHFMKLINPSTDKTIKSYFLKSFADQITFLSTPELKSTNLTITPIEVIKQFNRNEDLIIV